MTGKSLLIIGALTLSSMSIASAKSYDITLTAPAKAGATELKPGQYKLKVEGSQAVLTDEQTSKSFSIAVTMGHSDKKFDFTSVETTSKDGMDNIQAIDLGGSNTRLEVGQ
jgi:hypothetical protein